MKTFQDAVLNVIECENGESEKKIKPSTENVSSDTEGTEK